VHFNSVFARGSLMLASAFESSSDDCVNKGIFRSVDFGVTWTNVFPSSGRAIGSDPNDPNRFYAIVDDAAQCGTSGTPNGVLTSTDKGATWTFTSSIVPITEGSLNNGQFTFSANSRVWSALLKDGRDATFSYSDNQGSTWTIMDKVLVPGAPLNGDGLHPKVKPGGQGAIHFALLASKTNSNEVYVGGDTQEKLDGEWPNHIGATSYSGTLWRGDASVTGTKSNPSPQWEHMTNDQGIEDIPGGGTARGTGPHSDCRDGASCRWCSFGKQ